ncbi:TraX family protein [Patescibacteria group bacterium]
MNSFQIKLIAIVTMVIDHIGAFFFPEHLIFRTIGRLSFPLFSFLIANGAHYTKNINKYIGRMFIFALISQLPYRAVLNTTSTNGGYLNVLFTFFIALVAISLIRKFRNKLLILATIVISCIVANHFDVDYGAFGILLIISFYLLFKNYKATILSFILLSVANSIVPTINTDSINISKIDAAPIISMFSLIFILAYNYKEGLRAKYLFYFFYPLQFFMIYVIKAII